MYLAFSKRYVENFFISFSYYTFFTYFSISVFYGYFSDPNIDLKWISWMFNTFFAFYFSLFTLVVLIQNYRKNRYLSVGFTTILIIYSIFNFYLFVSENGFILWKNGGLIQGQSVLANVYIIITLIIFILLAAIVLIKKK